MEIRTAVRTTLALWLAAGAASAAENEWVTVAAPGNAPDASGFGAVAAPFAIARSEVTQGAWAAFLNSVAAEDPAELWDPAMDHAAGIARHGVPGSHSYSVAAGAASLPVAHVSFTDALRYANWLHNGRPAGVQDATTTEDGAYSLALGASASRRSGARIFIPSEDEWHKAAYYDAASGAWRRYPVDADAETVCTALTVPSNAANCDDVLGAPTPVGSYPNAASPAGTLDQAGNLFEWTEGRIAGTTRVVRGGSWYSDPADQSAGFRASADPALQTGSLGLRVAPEPAGPLAVLVGAGFLFLGWRARRRGERLGAAALAALAVFGAGPPAAARCGDVVFPAALAPGAPADQEIFGRLCEAEPAPSATLLVLVHGITYDHRYWDLAEPTGGGPRYSFAAAAAARGFATLAVDRLGAGRSSHPPSFEVTIEANAHALHEVIAAVRAGDVANAAGERFQRVVAVGHSYGSWTLWFEATRHDDLDGIVLTGATHGLTTVDGPFGVGSSLYPAVLDPLYTEALLDPGYLTTRPGTRYPAFYAPGPVDPALVAADEATKGTVTSAEIQSYPLILAEPLDLRVPVFLAVGSHDRLFCGPAPGGADCSSGEALAAFERPFLGPDVPSLDAFVLPGGGHDLEPMWNAGLYREAVLDWVEGLPAP